MDYQTSAGMYDSFAPEGPAAGSMEMDLSLASSVTLARLAEEVKSEMPSSGRYDRTHNRHNR